MTFALVALLRKDRYANVILLRWFLQRRISHALWRDEDHIIVRGPHAGSIHFHLYRDRDGGEVQVVGNAVLTENGHMTFSPVNPRWLKRLLAACPEAPRPMIVTAQLRSYPAA